MTGKAVFQVSSQPLQPSEVSRKRQRYLRVLIAALGATLVVVAIVLGIVLSGRGSKQEVPKTSPLFTFQHSALVSDGEPCAAIGKSILEKGGSAVDAAVAMVLCGGVVNPGSSGLGGGFLMTIYNSSERSAIVVDAREVAPSRATRDMFHGNLTASTKGGLSIAVPGELRGLELAHARYGRLNWSDLVMPSVYLCRDGVPVSHYLAKHISDKSEAILANAGLRDQFTNPETGKLFREGEVLRRRLLGDTLEKVALNGSDALYLGDMADNIAKEIQAVGGILTREDMASYTAKWRTPVNMSLPGDLLFYSVPPPGSGAIVAFILNVISGFNFTSSSVSDVKSTVLTYHRMIEAYKFAFAKRSLLGDPAFVDVSQVLENLTSSEFALDIRRMIPESSTLLPENYSSYYAVGNDHGTAHCQVLAPNGDAVAVTSTINNQFGSMFASPSTGIIFNDEMDDFSSPNLTNTFGLRPSEANFISPGKRPLSSMSPSVLVDLKTGQPWMVIGANGGSRIITSIVQVMAGVMWFGQSLDKAIDQPRFHDQLFPDQVLHEKDFQQVYIDGLEKMGYKTDLDPAGSVVLGIVRTKSGFIGASYDYRKGGSADGN